MTTRHEEGVTVLEMGGREFKLKANIDAADAIDNAFGGVVPALEEIRKLNGRTLVEIIAIGVGTKSKGGRENIRQLVFDTGRTEVAPIVVKYLVSILNPAGSKDTDEEQTDDEQTEGNA